MNIFLVPYTWLRHLSMALWCAGAGLFAWWTVLTAMVVLGVEWPPGMDGPILLCSVSGSVAAASVLGEGNLRRRPVLARLWRVSLTAALAVSGTAALFLFWDGVVMPVIFSGLDAEDAADPSLVSLTYRIGAFMLAGLACGVASGAVRKGRGIVGHLGAGPAAGLAAAAAWHVMNSSQLGTDLYLAGAALGLVWGFVFGLLAWGIPDDLYAGWVRVLTPNRFARRIPIDALDGDPKERFMGHFPRGLDMFLPVEDGVMELHVSIAVDAEQRYAARGLSLHPTMVKRFLEKIDLRYDPRRPAPLETRLSSGDRITMGEGVQSTEVEFLMLPKEET